jgi:hypothetical protein
MRIHHELVPELAGSQHAVPRLLLHRQQPSVLRPGSLDPRQLQPGTRVHICALTPLSHRTDDAHVNNPSIDAQATYTQSLPSNYQYFSDPSEGGALDLIDFCPYYQPFQIQVRRRVSSLGGCLVKPQRS